MKIDRIYINTYRYDFLNLRICIASIRYWYPDIPISLIKDNASGKFDTSILEKKWQLDILYTKIKNFGWGFGKLEPLFLPESHSFLVLDSDTVFTGYVLSEIEDIDADFIVDDEVQIVSEVKRLYYDTDHIKKVYPDFVYPGYTFNSGQWFGKTHKISEADFAKILEWKEMPVLKFPAYFMPGDQGILNLMIHYKESKNEIKVCRTKIMLWPKDNGADMINLESIKSKKNTTNRIIHWAGLKKNKLDQYERSDILRFYLKYFQKDLNFIETIFMNLKDILLKIEKKLKYQLSRV